MNFDDVLYLDIDFLADQYEEASGTSPDTVISKNEGMKASAGISFLKSGLHSQVTKQYKVSNQAMLKAIWEKIDSYEPAPEHFIEVGMKPRNIWIEGRLSIGHWDRKNTPERDNTSDEVLNRFYEIKANQVTYSLLPKQEYFSANLEALEIISPALQRYINIPVRLLGKALYSLPDIKTTVIAPYLMLASETITSRSG